MSNTLSVRTRKRLNIQGFGDVDDATLAPVAPRLRMAFGGCALLAASGTVLASPTILWILTPIAALAALFPVHPFDLIYNHGIRHLTKTGPLPKRRAPSRFACGVGAVWLVATVSVRPSDAGVRAGRCVDRHCCAGEHNGYLHPVDDLQRTVFSARRWDECMLGSLACLATG